MKICLVGHEYPPNVVSGPGTAAKNLVDELIAANHEVTVITPRLKGGKQYEQSGGLKIHRIELFKGVLHQILKNDFRFEFSMKLFLLKRKIDFGKFDILHIFDINDAYFIDKKIAKKVPVVISVNDFYALETGWNIFKFPYACTDLPLRFFYYNFGRLVFKRILKQASVVLANTDAVAESLKSRLMISPEKVKVVYRGIDFSRFYSLPGKFQSRKILFIGGNMERKGIRYLIEAARIIARKHNNVLFNIVGKANRKLQNILERRIKKYNLQKNINFISYVSPENIVKYYAEANVFVLPSVIGNMGQVMLEAMASRTPVVCTNTGSHSYAVGEKAGILVEPRDSRAIADALIKILADEDSAKRMGEEGRKRVEKVFNKKRMLSETIKVYEYARQF